MNASGGIGRKAKLGRGQQIQARYKARTARGQRSFACIPKEFPSHFNVIRLDTGTPDTYLI